jgi:hypothetical protein
MRPLAMQNVLFVLLAANSGQAHAAEPPSVVSGRVRVIDGDTIVLINTNTHIRLNGVDAPEAVYDHDDDFGRKRAPRCAQSSAPPSCVAKLNGEGSYERLVRSAICRTGPTSVPRSLAGDWRSTAGVGRSAATGDSKFPDPRRHPSSAVLPGMTYSDADRAGLSAPDGAIGRN